MLTAFASLGSKVGLTESRPTGDRRRPARVHSLARLCDPRLHGRNRTRATAVSARDVATGNLFRHRVAEPTEGRPRLRALPAQRAEAWRAGGTGGGAAALLAQEARNWKGRPTGSQRRSRSGAEASHHPSANELLRAHLARPSSLAVVHGFLCGIGAFGCARFLPSAALQLTNLIAQQRGFLEL